MAAAEREVWMQRQMLMHIFKRLERVSRQGVRNQKTRPSHQPTRAKSKRQISCLAPAPRASINAFRSTEHNP